MIPKDIEQKIFRTMREHLGDIDLLQINHFGYLQVGFNGRGAQTPVQYILQDMQRDPENWHVELIAEYKRRLGISDSYVNQGRLAPESEAREQQNAPAHAKVVGFIGRAKPGDA